MTKGGSGTPPPEGAPLPTWEEYVAKERDDPDGVRAMQAVYEKAMEKMNVATNRQIEALSAGLESSTHTTVGVDGNTIVLDFVRPAAVEGHIPCIYYIHGGGMASMSMRNACFRQLARLLARQGVAVCLVEFRNSVTLAMGGAVI